MFFKKIFLPTIILSVVFSVSLILILNNSPIFFTDMIFFFLFFFFLALSSFFIKDFILDSDLKFTAKQKFALITLYSLTIMFNYFYYTKNVSFKEEQIVSYCVIDQDLNSVEFTTTEGSTFKTSRMIYDIDTVSYITTKLKLTNIRTKSQKCFINLKTVNGKLLDTYHFSSVICKENPREFISDYNCKKQK